MFFPQVARNVGFFLPSNTSNSRGTVVATLGGGCGAMVGCHCWHCVAWCGMIRGIWTLHWIMVGFLLNTRSYTVITLKTQKLMYAVWGLCKDSGVSQYEVVNPPSITKPYDFCVFSFSRSVILLRVK